MTVVIERELPTDPDVVGLLEAHLAFSRTASPPEHVHALDLDGLTADDVWFFTAREHGELLGVGALRLLDQGRAEIKSMHTSSVARGRGIARSMLDRLIATARNEGITWLGLETGSMNEFGPARRLYQSAGFTECQPFGDYTLNPFSICMSMPLTEE